MNHNNLKGLLIILVIFDHNEYAHQIFPDFLRGFSFHVLGFFVLPFFRSAENISLDKIKKMAVAYLYPYVWLSLGMLILSSILQQRSLLSATGNFLPALYSGNAIQLKASTGMALLWFLPSFFSLMVLRAYLASLNHVISACVIFSIACAHPLISLIPPSLQSYIPLGLLPALYAFPLIFLIVFFQEKLISKIEKNTALTLSALLFLLVKYFQIKMNLTQELGFVDVSNYHQPVALFVNDLEGISGVLLMLQIARIPLSTLIESCGKYSLPIYLFHAFFALMSYRLLERFFDDYPSPLRLALSMIATIGITLTFAIQLYKMEKLRSVLFYKL